MRLSLIVKGDRGAAITAARLHGVDAVWSGDILDWEHKYSSMLADESEWLRVVCWFLADAECVPPYLTGALLHYSLKSE